ncbi:cation:proton antiporter [Rhodocaloribacter sp.]
MTESDISALLLYLTILFGATYLLAAFFSRFRIPGIIGALFVAMAAHYTPVGAALTSGPLAPSFSFLGQLGVLFLLFFIGLQIDLKEMRTVSGDIVWLTALNTVFPFLFGVAVMLLMGYGWLVAFVIGLTRMPTAEAVIVPILDEFRLIRTRVGEFIVGAGVLDDLIEVFLVAFVSIWIGEQSESAVGGAGGEIVGLMIGLTVFVLMLWISHRWVLPRLARLLPRTLQNLIMLSMLALLGFGGFAEYAHLGMVVGAITAGVVIQPVFRREGNVGDQASRTLQSISYGFFGLIFFFWVGLSVDLGGLIRAPMLAVLLFLAAFLGKLTGVFAMVPMKKLTRHEAWTIGIGLNARLTTEIIVARLLLDARLIDLHLFTALVAASSLSTIIVPLVFTLLVRWWGERLRKEPLTGRLHPASHAHARHGPRPSGR